MRISRQFRFQERLDDTSRKLIALTPPTRTLDSESSLLAGRGLRLFPVALVLSLLFLSLCSFARPPQTSVAEQSLELMRRGHYQEAVASLETRQSPGPFELRLLLELAHREGKKLEADQYAQRLLRLYQSGRLRSGDQISQAAYAAWSLGRWEDANNLYIEASESDTATASLFVDWGNLYLEKYNAAEAESIFQEAMTVSSEAAFSRWDRADIHLCLARALRDQGRPGAREALEEASSTNPKNLQVLAYKSRLAVMEESWDEAEKSIQKGLDLNSRYLPLLELQAAFHFFQGDLETYEKVKEKILAINPRNARLFELFGDIAVATRRMPEAIDFYARALELDPEAWSALASKGINELRLGREREGRQSLERAYANDPYNIWTVNTLRLIDSFDRFQRFETPGFEIKLHQKEAGALRPYVEALLENSLQALQKKYQHQVEGRVVFEMYPDHEDFAVRTLGLPGLGALGATFGKVIAMDSPSARPRGEFHWGSTLWHEMAHVITLSLSNHRVPRWFTEGLSMMEERLGGQGWGDRLSPNFVQAYQKGLLLPLADLNSGFIRPKFPGQVAISYYQAGWVCEFLEREYGFSKIREMLIAYADDSPTDSVFQEVLGKSVEEVDQQFQKELEQQLNPLVQALEPVQPVPDVNKLADQLEQHPGNYWLHLEMGRKLQELGRDQEAVSHLNKALEIFPFKAGEDSPYELLLENYKKRNMTEEASQVLRQAWEQSPLDVEWALELSRLLSELGRSAEAADYLSQALYADPLSPELHQMLGELYLKTGKPEKAAREFSVLLELQPVNPADTHFQLARALLKSGDRTSAKRHVLLSLEIAPSYEQAQKLLLELAR